MDGSSQGAQLQPAAGGGSRGVHRGVHHQRQESSQFGLNGQAPVSLSAQTGGVPSGRTCVQLVQPAPRGRVLDVINTFRTVLAYHRAPACAVGTASELRPSATMFGSNLLGSTLGAGELGRKRGQR
jgi:hypothetical protein